MARLIVDDINDSRIGNHDIDLHVSPSMIADIFNQVIGTEAWGGIKGVDSSVYIKAPKDTVEKIKEFLVS